MSEAAGRKRTPADSALRTLRESIERKASAQVIQLPLWPDAKRGTPNSFIRSALFAAIQSKDRVFLKETTVASQKGITVKFTGEQLNQEDLSVWETLAHLARNDPLGQVSEFSAHGLLRSLGLHTGLSQHKQLHSTILRLTACAVEITHEGRTYFGPLIKSGAKDEVTSHYCVELNRDLIRLFGESQWTAVDWRQRQDLRGKHLAQALHAFYSSHRQPFPIKLDSLREYVGSRNQRATSFRSKLKTALEDLVAIGFLAAFSIEDDVISVQRATQAHHRVGA